MVKGVATIQQSATKATPANPAMPVKWKAPKVFPMKRSMRERERHTETDRQKEKEADRQTEKEADRDKKRERDRQDRDRQTETDLFVESFWIVILSC